MELILTKEDVERILLEWSQKDWPDAFNHCEVNNNYQTQVATLSKVVTVDPPTPLRAA